MTTVYDTDAKFGEHGRFIQPETPKVGMGATQVMYSDRNPLTITRVSASGKTFWVKKDDVEKISEPIEDCNSYQKALNELNETQEWKITSNPNNPEIRVNKTKNGWNSSDLGKIIIGMRVKHYDYEF